MSRNRFKTFETRNGLVTVDRKTNAWYLTKHGRIVDYGTTREIASMFSVLNFSAQYERACVNGGD